MSWINPILNVDSYKASHYLQYPESTEYVSSYIESRGGEFEETLFFGLQAFIKEYLAHPICREDIVEADEVFNAHGLPFNWEGWQYILEKHQGYLPIEIQAVAEGSAVPTRNVLLQVMNTDPRCAWLSSYVETALLRAVWYPTTVATLSRACKKIIRSYLLETADELESLPFKLHDFGARGVSSEESAALGGAAHLVNFMGSDTVSGVMAARRYYDEPMAAFSIPAAEHSTITCWGRDREAEAYANMLDRFGEDGKLLAVVSDSYDLWSAIDRLWGDQLKQRVIDSGATVVIRPDSGDPVQVVTEAIERLMTAFGHSTNRKGYRLLPPYIRVIQGDGINLTSIEAILAAMKAKGLSADNIAFGMGGALLQQLNRDTLRFAMKASAAKIAGVWQDVYKDPLTDQEKRSKRGRLALVRDGSDVYKTIREEELASQRNELRTVYRNGRLLINDTFQSVRERAQLS